MMDCQAVRETYDPTVDSETAVHEHLLECGGCRGYANEMRRLRSLLEADPVVPVPRDFDAQVRQRLERARRNPLNWWRVADLRYALPVAAMVLVAVTTVVMLNQSQDGSHSVPGESAQAVPVQTQIESVPESKAEDEATALAKLTGSAGAKTPASLSWPGAEMPETSEPDVQSRRIRLNESDRLTSSRPQVILRVRDEVSQQERLVTIPSVVFGAEPVLVSTRQVQNELENVY